MFPLSVSDSMSDVPERTDLNVSRRLRRMLRASGLPRVGRAHNLRMRFVQATHVLLILRHQCTHAQIVLAMQELLQGWAETEEEDCGVGGYQHRLLTAIDDIHAKIVEWTSADWTFQE
jgi:hypothetical protein